MNSKKDMFKSMRGTFERLNTNYSQWSASMKRALKADGLWRIVGGSEKCPEDPATSNNPANSGSTVTSSADITSASAIDFTLAKLSFLKRQDEALLHDACSVGVRSHIEHLQSPEDIWNTLKARMNSAASEIGRQTLKARFHPTSQPLVNLSEIGFKS